MFAIFYDFSVRINRLLLTNIYQSLEQITSLNSRWFVSQFEHETNIIQIASESIGSAEEYYLENDAYMMRFLQTVCDNSNFEKVVFSDINGRQLTNIGEVGDASDSDYFKAAMQGRLMISNPFISKFTNERCIVVSCPVYYSAKIVGVIHGSYYIDTTNSLFIENEYNEDTYGFITQINGNIILQSNHTDRLNSSNNLLGFFDNVKFDADYNAGKLRTAIAHGESGTFGYELNGEHRYISFTPVGINDWYSFTATSGELASESLSTIGYIVFQASLKLIIIAVVVTIGILIFKNKKEKVINKLNKDLLAEIEKAYFDPVTQHDNYFRFRARAIDMIMHEKDKKFIIIYTNIKNFKYINDAFGFEIGNKVLRKSIEWLTVQGSLIFARVSADNFVAIKEYDDEEEVRRGCEDLAALELDVSDIAEGLSTINVYAGVYCVPYNSGLTLEAMIDRARMALNKAQATMPNGCVMYDESMRFNMLETQRMENKMRSSLANNEFKVYFQPKINICDNRIVSCEALSRWEDPERGLISPGAYIPLFERNGFIKQLDVYMFRTVCATVKKWLKEGKNVIPVSVNVSKTLLYSTDFISDYISIKNEFNIPDGLIEVEFTESVITDNKVLLGEVLTRFRNNGIKCAIDDFGAGYSSLNLLKDLPADILKIDKAFFDKTEYGFREKAIIKSVVAMANELSMQIVAEGVEFNEQVEFLRSVNCCVIQGYVFDRPMPMEAFESKYLN